MADEITQAIERLIATKLRSHDERLISAIAPVIKKHIDDRLTRIEQRVAKLEAIDPQALAAAFSRELEE